MNENRALKKFVATKEDSSIVSAILVPEDLFIYLFLTSFLVGRTFKNASSVKKSTLLRRVENQKMQTSVISSVRVENGHSCSRLRMPPALD